MSDRIAVLEAQLAKTTTSLQQTTDVLKLVTKVLFQHEAKLTKGVMRAR